MNLGRQVCFFRNGRNQAVRIPRDPENRAAGLLALRTVAEAYGGLGAVAAEAGISRESLMSRTVAQRESNA